jgi:hypothetical protein
MRLLIAVSIAAKSISSHLYLGWLSNDGSDDFSIKVNLRRKAESNASILRSAVFMVPMSIKFAGTPKSSFEYGRLMIVSCCSPRRLSFSMRVMSSPKILATVPLLISSIMRY